MKCGSQTSLGGECCNKVEKDGDACYIHKAKKLQQLNDMYKRELASLHSKMRSYSQRLADTKSDAERAKETLEFIDRVDLMKKRLTELAGGRHLVKVLRDWSLRNEIEDIVGVEFKRAKPFFFDQLDKRNYICHRHTMAEYWD